MDVFADESADKSVESVNSIWEEVWTDTTAGYEAGVKLYLEVTHFRTCPVIA